MQLRQLGYDAAMTRWMLLGGVLLAAGCTKANPAAKCSTGTCIDPSYPFCDVDGSLSGSAGSCISVSCTPGDFKECRGDVALTCNAMGNNYDELQCQMGCTPEAKGCKLCQAGQTVCTNGEVQTCDASGAVTSATPCALGCYQNDPRCRLVDASNGFGQYGDMVPSPPDVSLGSGSFSLMDGSVIDQQANVFVSIPNFLAPAPSGGVPVRVYVVNSLHVHDATFNGTGGDIAVAIISAGDIVIDGTVSVLPGSGSYSAAGCNGADGTYTDRDNESTCAGGGGGANATNGAPGGNVLNGNVGNLETGGAAGAAAGTANLTPLRGGCGGGYSATTGMHVVPAAGGGGAIQLTSGTRISVNGTIDVRGGQGADDYYQTMSNGTGYIVGGGGGGGSMLLEAPAVILSATAKLLATGGDGGQNCTTSTSDCGIGGHGATAGVAATRGTDAQNVNSQLFAVTAGGGGGGLGRIRINTPDQTYTKTNSSVEDGDLTVGVLATR